MTYLAVFGAGLSGLLLLALGVTTVLRGLDWLPHALLGHHALH